MYEELIGIGIPLLIIAWGIGTTIVGLWLQWKNNFRYNAAILDTLRDIRTLLEKEDKENDN